MSSAENKNNPTKAQDWQPPTQSSSNVMNPAPAPGWSVPTPQQPSQRRAQEAQAQAYGIYPQLLSYNTIFQNNQPVSGPQIPTPQAAGAQHAYLPQTSGDIPQYYAAQQTKVTNQPKYYAQPPVFEQEQPNKNSCKHSQGNTQKTKIHSDSNIWATVNQNRIPSNAFQAGHDTDGTKLLICRAAHDGDMVPGKVVPHHGCAYVAYGGKEHAKHSYEVLVGDKYQWIQSSGGKRVQNAVEGGKTHDGEILYIGRVNFKNSLTPGKIHPSHHSLYIPYGGREISFTAYEILVHA